MAARAATRTAKSAPALEMEPSTMKRLADEASGEGERVSAAYVEALIARELSTSDVQTDIDGLPLNVKNVTPATEAVAAQVRKSVRKSAAAKPAPAKVAPAMKKTAAKLASKTTKVGRVVIARQRHIDATKPAAVKVERVPAATFLAEIKRLGITKSQAARACSVSPSLVTEWSGGGRHNLLAASRWDAVREQLAAFAAGLK